MQISKFRKYTVSISAHKKAPQIADNVPRDFDCVISEPSIWLLPGSTDERGLSFFDKKGESLKSCVFKDLAFFQVNNTIPEEAEITMLVYGLLFDHYNFEKSDVKVVVTKQRK